MCLLLQQPLLPLLLLHCRPVSGPVLQLCRMHGCLQQLRQLLVMLRTASEASWPLHYWHAQQPHLLLPPLLKSQLLC